MKRWMEYGAALAFLIGMLMAAGAIGNLEFADMTGAAGFTPGQFWLRIIIAVALMAIPVIVSRGRE